MEVLKTEKIYFSVADKVIELVFEPSELTILRENLITNIKRLWGPSGFITRKTGKVDFLIRFASDPPEVLVRKNKYYYLTYQTVFGRKRVDTSYYLSLSSFQMLVKDVVSYLLEKDGFFLHGSSRVGKDGVLRGFLAPSGGGKTTAASLLPSGYLRFSDDIFIVKKTAGEWNFFSAPFIEKGNLPKKLKARNAEFYFLNKSKKEGKSFVGRKDILLKKVISQVWLRGPLTPKLLKLVSRFIKDYKFYELSFNLKSDLEKILK